MGKKGDFLAVFLIVVMLSAGNIYVYFNNSGMSISSLAIKEISTRLVRFDVSTILFLAQWLLILIIVIFFYWKLKKVKKPEEIKEKAVKIETKRGADTDLDILYDLLKQKKRIRVPVIAKSFKIDEEKALEWCKILENYGLVSIDYPAFSAPEVEVK